MKYYLSGAITHQPDFKTYFKNYEEELRHWGIADIFNPAATECPKDKRWEICMKFDIKILMNCACLVLLPNWRKSKGVKIELYLSKRLGIRVIKFYDLVRELMNNDS